MKKIRKILPLSIYDIPGIERWLEEQANNGLFPVSVGSWVTFTPDGVPGTRFRLEPYGKSGTEPTEEQPDSDFKTMSKANTLVIAFPLYFFCLPGLLTRFVQDYYSYYLKNKIQVRGQKIYAIVNCGFPEVDINTEAVKVIKSFSQHIGAEFRFAIMVGSGGMVIGAKDAPFMKKTLAALEQAMELLAQDAVSDGADTVGNIQIMVKCPRWLYYFMANKGFVHTASKNGISRKAILRKRYQPD